MPQLWRLEACQPVPGTANRGAWLLAEPRYIWRVDLIGIALVAVLLVFGGRYLYQRSPKQRERRQIKSLMIDCDGDQELAERLIFAEMERQEGLSFAEAARRARNRLRHDRR